MTKLLFAIAASGLVEGVALQKAAPLVDVTFITEAGCPPCQDAITRTVNQVVTSKGLAAIMDLNQIPFGNNYFATKECGGAPYDPDTRHCWAAKCVAAKNPAADCFSGTVVTQHGPNELAVNKMEACAKNLLDKWQDYWPFLVCMETNYEKGVYVEGAGKCATSSGLSESFATKLNSCYHGKLGQQFLVKEAKATIDHPGTPTMLVAGKPLDSIDDMLSAVCGAYTGEKPAGCKKIMLRDHDMAKPADAESALF